MAIGSLDHSGLIEPSELNEATAKVGWLDPGPSPVGSRLVGTDWLIGGGQFTDMLHVWKISSIVANYDCTFQFSGLNDSSVDDDR